MIIPKRRSILNSNLSKVKIRYTTNYKNVIFINSIIDQLKTPLERAVDGSTQPVGIIKEEMITVVKNPKLETPTSGGR